MGKSIKIINLSKLNYEKDNWKHTVEFTNEIREFERDIFLKIISDRLSAEDIKTIETPSIIYPQEKSVLAVHWHPEFIPIDLIKKRIHNTFPSFKNELIIPTQHNVVLNYNDYYGVEIDCFSKEFNRKVQLLLHFKNYDPEKAVTLNSIIEHTFKYRSKQLFELIHFITSPSMEDKFKIAIKETESDDLIVAFLKYHTSKLDQLIQTYDSKIPVWAIQNKLLRNYIDELRFFYDEKTIHRTQLLFSAVKRMVKKDFNVEYFYNTKDLIEEARSANAGIVIPHPEQFWPILLADYDVDGYEVWNPQSREFTNFLMNVLIKQNKTLQFKDKPLLLFMGDDTHMGEKIRALELQDPEKAGREIGVQLGWEDPDVQKTLIASGFSKERIIDEYKSRLE
ncbi:MAG: hypothetical protein JXA60_07295 [Candidatus Coatesbacteria bacterium]|nr:hypothetical protein [Candidatus Coatesbacteria bacterium]